MLSYAQKKAKSRGISINGEGGYRRHILLCVGNACCSNVDGLTTWKYLAKRLRALEKRGIYIYCSQVDCLFFCRCGPLAVVYPEGTWYENVSVEVCERIIEEHLIGGVPVQEHICARNPLVREGEELQGTVEFDRTL